MTKGRGPGGFKFTAVATDRASNGPGRAWADVIWADGAQRESEDDPRPARAWCQGAF